VKVLAKLRIEPFMIGILASVAVAALMPARGAADDVLDWATKIAIALLFFLYGARLHPREALTGLRHWRLHATVLAATYLVFPVLGLVLRALAVVPADLATGVVYLCLLPSTMQSSIAFTSIARGNVAGAVVSASLSNLLGVFVTPVLVMLLMHTTGGAHVSGEQILAIGIQLLLPFFAGQVLRPWLGALTRHAAMTTVVDRGSIYLVVYAAFSAGMVEHIWRGLTAWNLLAMAGVCVLLLAVALAATTVAGRVFGFERADQIVITFCGSKKSLASGLPMATVLFAGRPVGLIVLPLMIFHQIQLLTCAWLAGEWGRRAQAPVRTSTAASAPA
jgi:sodium/bile acid cotransporter 7